MLNPADVEMTNSKVRLYEEVPTRYVRRISDGDRVLIDDRQFDPKVYVEESEYQAEPVAPNAL